MPNNSAERSADYKIKRVIKMNKKFVARLTTGLLMLGMVTMANAALIDQWSFNETSGATAYDSIGGINGTLVGGATFMPSGGISGGAIKITDGYVNMSHNFAAMPNFAVQAWVKIEPGATNVYCSLPEASYQQFCMIPVAEHRAGIPEGYFLGVNTARFNTESLTFASPNYPIGNIPLTDGTWHQLVGVYNSDNTASIYVDGQLAGSASDVINYNTTADFMVGGFWYLNTGRPINTFNGLIDEVQLYDNSLSANDVTALYNSYNQNAVPEPSTIFLFSAGLVGLIGSKLKKSNSLEH